MSNTETDIVLPAESPDKSRTKTWQRFLLNLIPFIERRVQTVPRSKAVGYGRVLGDLAFRFAKKARNTAFKNLRFVYGDTLTEAERNRIVRDVFRHFCIMAVDFLRGPLLKNPDDLNALILSVEGWDENIEPLLREKRGVVICTAHFGNWEMLGRYIVSRGVPLTVVVRNPEDESFSAWAKRMREGAGFTVSAKGESAKRLLTVLKRGEALGILPDQSSGDVFVPFFGIPTGTATGPALLAGRSNAGLIPCWCFADPEHGYRYRIIFEPLIPMSETGDKQGDLASVMTEVNARLEARIRKTPEQWLWLHDRWKGTFEQHNRERLPEGLELSTLRERFR
ncbi:MAG: lysophospholipid acyltransferase family protein [Akkermansiaceae bacterium]|nr:lysophospholipid acyltransferase family protein [Armatimonadota bacterium]